VFGYKEKTTAYGLLLIAVLVPLFALGLSNHGLWTPDEPRVAEIGREMALTGNWAVPTLNRKPFLEKPPLYFWSVALTFRVFHVVSDRVARIPSAVFGIGGAVGVFFLAAMLFGPRVGFISAFVTATSFEYFRAAHWLIVDSALACFVIWAMTSFMAAYLSQARGRRLLFYIFFYLFCGLAFLSKGLIGLAFPGVGVLVFLAFEKDLKEIWKMQPWIGIAILAALSLPWLLALWHQGGGPYLDVFLLKNNLLRFLPGGTSGHHKPFYYYFTHLPGSFLPWSILLVPVLYRSFGRSQGSPAPSGPGLLFMKCWSVSGFALLSLASTKRGIYLLPILAPFSILTALWIESILRSRPPSRGERIFLWGLALVLLGAGLVLGPMTFYLSSEMGFLWAAHAVLVIGLSGVTLKFLRKAEMDRFWIGTHGTVLALLIFVLLWILPPVDRYKSFASFCREVKEAVGADTPLYGYKPDETLRGVVPFYTGRYIEEIGDDRVLADTLSREDPVFVVAMDKRGVREREIFSSGRVYLLLDRKVGDRRTCLLFTNRKNRGVKKDSSWIETTVSERP